VASFLPVIQHRDDLISDEERRGRMRFSSQAILGNGGLRLKRLTREELSLILLVMERRGRRSSRLEAQREMLERSLTGRRRERRE